ncbi:MAG TPA: ABC transporter substrate-binding protein [Ochrobactrum intermedium]|uniref:ABC transporter substrate-binding protein n=1 Tax=Brucella intermedia TaxID=94625 RepID=A0A7V6PEG0_9HYPH|nr:ABC transporter substrate-binding protein [Brucella intermedia]HHV69459.1 ABC transporter substrate-binding protein [Brucella intermedia]
MSMKTVGKLNLSRRSLMLSAGAALAAPALMRSHYAFADNPLTLVTWGGAYQDLIQKVFADPYAKETGVAVRLLSGPDLAKAKGQVRSGQVEWDVIDVTAAMVTAGEAEDLWEPLPADIVDPADLLLPLRKSSAPYLMFGGVMGYAPGRAGDKYPRTFKDFFDVEKVPGRRGLRTRISETLEIALVADGVDPKSLYPLDVERGFAVLDKIKPHVTKWIDQTPQTISLVQNNEIDFVYTYNGRVESARTANIDMAFSQDQALILNQYLAVLKGSSKAEEAIKFVAYCMSSDRQAEFANAYYSVPARKSALAKVRPEVASRLPDINNPANVVMNDTWWGENYVELDRRFKEWLAS